MQRLVFALGGMLVFAAFFFGTLHILDSSSFKSMDAIRIEHAKSLKVAMQNYRAARGKYPSPFPDNDLADLKAELVGGKFIPELPTDPYWKNSRVNRYRYRSDGTTYGMLFYLELGPCQTGVGAAATTPWDGKNILTCPF